MMQKSLSSATDVNKTMTTSITNIRITRKLTSKPSVQNLAGSFMTSSVSFSAPMGLCFDDGIDCALNLLEGVVDVVGDGSAAVVDVVCGMVMEICFAVDVVSAVDGAGGADGVVSARECVDDTDADLVLLRGE